MSIPHDSTWGAAYLQIAVLLLVFSLGLPGLLIQVMIPENLRRIHFPRFAGAIAVIAPLLVLLPICWIFVWAWHPGGGGH